MKNNQMHMFFKYFTCIQVLLYNFVNVSNSYNFFSKIPINHVSVCIALATYHMSGFHRILPLIFLFFLNYDMYK